MRKVKVKKIQKSVYNAPVKRLEQELAQLRLLIEHEQQQQQATRDAWLLLAEAILQHKVMFQLLLPLQRERLQSASGCDEPWLSAVNQFPIFGDWNRMLLLASATNPLMEATLTVTGDELKRLAYRTVEEICESLRAAVQKLVTLREMLSPERYPEPLVVCAGVQPPQAAAAGAEQGTDLGASACAVQYSLEPDLDKAATDLLTRLQDLQSAERSMLASTLVLVLNRSPAIFESGNINMETGELSEPPLSHYLQAARRLCLTSRQLQQLRLMLKQFNRMAEQQHQDGQLLVSLSQDSFALQTSISGAAGTQQTSASGAAGMQQTMKHTHAACCGGGQQTDAAVHLAETSRQGGAGSSQSAINGGTSCSSNSSSSRELPAPEEGIDVSAEDLMDLMQQHLKCRRDMTMVIIVWVACTLTYWQTAEYLVACWPYLPYYPALVELSAFLTPDDTPRCTVNSALGETAAKAAALADELGYTGAHAFMQRRCEALEAQLAWVQQEMQKQL